ncbi:MAG: hypothetical protein ACXWJU_09380, partial [Hyphomicrobium sp.]
PNMNRMDVSKHDSYPSRLTSRVGHPVVSRHSFIDGLDCDDRASSLLGMFAQFRPYDGIGM